MHCQCGIIVVDVPLDQSEPVLLYQSLVLQLAWLQLHKEHIYIQTSEFKNVQCRIRQTILKVITENFIVFDENSYHIYYSQALLPSIWKLYYLCCAQVVQTVSMSEALRRLLNYNKQDIWTDFSLFYLNIFIFLDSTTLLTL